MENILDTMHGLAAIFQLSQVGLNSFDAWVIDNKRTLVNGHTHQRPLSEEFFDKMGADETGTAGHEDFLALVEGRVSQD